MGRLGKTLISVGSILVVAIIGIVLYIYWPAIKGTVDGNKYYTQEDVQKAYDSGFADGNESETELTAKYEYYKTLVDDYYIQVSTLNEEISKISSENTKYSNQIKELTTQKSNLQTQVENLTTIKNNNNKTITDLNSQITELEKQVNNLTSSGEDKSEQITTLNSQISTLKNTVAQLQSTNEMNVATITSLNTQIANLNNQIADMTLQSQNSTSQITALNNKINELQKSVTYYESYIASLESGEQVVATFEYDGSVYNIQIVNKGSTVSVTTPTSTTYKIFNGWKVGDETIDLSTYTITTNTKIVADITYKYDVKFMVDNTTHNSQIIVKNNCATLPSNPTKNGYEFDGWSIDGVNVVNDIATKQVTDNTTYYAVFTKLHTVTFVYEDATKSTQTIRNGNYAINVTVDNTTYKVFNGWKVNDTIVDVETYKIYSDTTFIADITYKYDVRFMVGNTTHNSQIVVKNNCATLPTNPTKNGYEFDGWSIDGVNVVNDIATKQVAESTMYYAVFTKLHTVTFVYENETKSTQTIRNGSLATAPTIESTTYKVFNGWKVNNVIVDLSTYKITTDTQFVADITYKYEVKFMVGDTTHNSQIVTSGTSATLPTTPTKDKYVFTGWSIDGINIVDVDSYPTTENITFLALFREGVATFEPVIFNGLITFIGDYIWTDGENIYYSDYFNHYVYDKVTSVWKTKIWNGFSSFYGNNVWTLDDKVYYSKDSSQYVLDKATDTWSKMTWNSLTNFYGSNIWTDGENTYYSSGSSQYVLDKATSTWSKKIWNGLTSFDGCFIWIDGKNIYYSFDSEQYVLNKKTNTWSEKSWSSLLSFNGKFVWTDGENIYYSYVSTYVLDKKTNIWNTKSWKGLNVLYGDYIWTDGENIYYSNWLDHYVLDISTDTWVEKTWTGMSGFYGSNIWTDGENIYCSFNSNQYVLDKATSTWSKKTWNGLTSFAGANIWTDGENIYFSCVSSQYVLNKATNTWSKKTWNGLTSFNGSYIWTDGENIYYSNSSNQYVLDKTTSTWNIKTWNELSSLDGSNIWTDGENIYYSYGLEHYILTWS